MELEARVRDFCDTLDDYEDSIDIFPSRTSLSLSVPRLLKVESKELDDKHQKYILHSWLQAGVSI